MVVTFLAEGVSVSQVMAADSVKWEKDRQENTITLNRTGSNLSSKSVSKPDN